MQGPERTQRGNRDRQPQAVTLRSWQKTTYVPKNVAIPVVQRAAPPTIRKDDDYLGRNVIEFHETVADKLQCVTLQDLLGSFKP